MNLLLDTHIWIWNDLQPEKISSQVAQELASSSNDLWLSPVSVWELGLLLEKKKITISTEFHLWVAESAKDLQLKEVPFTWEVAQELRFTHPVHKDPADRFLAATAKVFDMTLVTADARLLEVPNLKTLPNVL
jgi:PIN domain nuclease of toxin-antitoxin system